MARLENTLNLLNHLIEVCIDGERGYRSAANEIHNGHHQILFRKFARDRAEYMAILEKEIRRLGGFPYHSGTGAGSFHRAWMKLRSILNREHDDLIVKECQKGERIASMNYTEALEEDLPPYLRTILASQLMGVLESRNRLRGMSSTQKEAQLH
jgi:uncharacterized protein (TIGR02284 family)